MKRCTACGSGAAHPITEQTRNLRDDGRLTTRRPLHRYGRHPLRGATPIRRGALPTDRVQHHPQNKHAESLCRDDGKHAQGEIRAPGPQQQLSQHSTSRRRQPSATVTSAAARRSAQLVGARPVLAARAAARSDLWPGPARQRRVLGGEAHRTLPHRCQPVAPLLGSGIEPNVQHGADGETCSRYTPGTSPAPSAPPPVSLARGSVLDSYPDATHGTHGRTPSTGSDARSHARSWGATRKARARGA